MSDGRRADGSYGPEYGPVPRELEDAWYPQLPSRTRRRSPWPLRHGDYPWRLSEQRFRRPPLERSSSWHPLQPYTPFQVHGSGATLNPRRRREDAGLTDEEFREAMDQLRKEEYRPQKKHGGGRGNLRTGSAAAPRETTDEEEKAACTICLETFLPGEPVAVTPCNHTFHQGCIAPWVQGHGNCPVCRFALCERSVADEDGGGMDLDLLAMVRAMEEAFSRFRFSYSTPHYH